MYKIQLIILFFIIGNACNAQDYALGYGKVKLSELTMKEYPEDKNADALIIYDLAKSYFVESSSGGFDVYFERAFKIKIFRKSGFNWSEIEIPYYYEGEIFEKVTDLEAISYNIEDGVIKRDLLNTKNIFDEKKNQYWRNKKFAMPNIKEGTVIEVKYKIISPYVFNLRNWEFQNKIPTVCSEYTTKMIPFYEYVYILQGRSKFDVFEKKEDTGFESSFAGIKYHDLNYTFGMKNIPAFNDESYITSYGDYITKLDFQLAKIQRPNGTKTEIISTWPKLNNDVLKETGFGKYCKVAEKSGKDILNPLELNGKTETEKLEYIVKLVKNNFNWNGMYGKYAQKTIKEFQKEKTGNIANINLFLTGLLRSAGIESYAVLSSTRDNGRIKFDYPFLHFFNYVLVLAKIDGKYTLVDGTEPMVPFNRIPARCINEKGLVVKKDGQDWVKLTHREPSTIEKSINIHFTAENDTLDCSIKNYFWLYEAFDYKKKYKNDIDDIRKSIIQLGYAEVDSIKTENYLETEKIYKLRYTVKSPVEKYENKLYIGPFLNETITQNPLKQSVRTYPVDFTYPFGRKFKSLIYIPNGYKVEFSPDTLKINNDLVSVEYQVSSLSDKILMVNGLYTFKNAVYDPEDYSKIKFYYNEIIKKFNEKVVLVKE